MKKRFPYAGAVALSVILFTGLCFPAEQAGDSKRGKLVYERYCLSCHGAQGDGQGEFADWTTPKPRDFRQGAFKCRSTSTGSLPTDADLERTLKNGLYGTQMPQWYPVGPSARRDVLAYVKSFSKRWSTESPGAPLPIPSEPPSDSASVERGRALYSQVGCDRCHGERGEGDEPSAHYLKDDWGNPVTMPNLAEEHFKCGEGAASAYRVLITGMNGTPMPSFRESLKDGEVWDLAHYVLSLGPSKVRRAPKQ